MNLSAFGFAESLKQIPRFSASLALFLGLLIPSGSAAAQEMVNDVFSGKLINPEVGVFAWYDLTDASTNKTVFLRMAVVGKDKVKRKEAWWVETQLVPQVGFPVVYKMLLTGPASKPKNIHEVYLQQEGKAVQKIEIPETPEAENETEEANRVSKGTEDVLTPEGPIKAEHFLVMGKNAAGEEVVSSEIWINESVRPMGLVRMQSKEGVLVLRRHGKGGEDGLSAIKSHDAGGGASEDSAQPDPKVKVRTNFSGKGKKQ